MNTYKRILVAVDLSVAAEAVMKTAVELGRALQAELYLVHIHKIHAGKLVEGGMADTSELAAREVAELEAKLEKFASKFAAPGVIITTNVYSGDPGVALNEVADRIGAEMIVMGTHGRTGLAHLVLGSVAENVLRHARVPVVAVRFQR